MDDHDPECVLDREHSGECGEAMRESMEGAIQEGECGWCDYGVGPCTCSPRPARVTVYVFRLAVTLPPAPPDNETWWDICQSRGWYNPDGSDDPPPFAWPRRRLYLSRSAADRRAEYLRELGATVVIERGEAVFS